MALTLTACQSAKPAPDTTQPRQQTRPAAPPTTPLRYAPARVAWPQLEGELSAPPLGGVLVRGDQEEDWVVWTRPGLTFQPEAATAALPKGSPAPNLPVFQGKLDAGGLENTPDWAREGDQWVLIAAEGGAPSSRVVGLWSPGREPALLSDLNISGDVLAVRIHSLAPQPNPAPLPLLLRAESCTDGGQEVVQTLETYLGQLPTTSDHIWVKDPARAAATLTLECKGQVWEALSLETRGARLLRTPFWSPTRVQLQAEDGIDGLVAMISHLKGDLHAALFSMRHTQGRTNDQIKAALAVESGWLDDAEALLGSREDGAARLLRAGVAHERGKTNLKALLNFPTDDPELATRGALARAAILLLTQGPQEAGRALQAPEDPRWRADILLGQVQIAMHQQDQGTQGRLLKELAGVESLDENQRALLWRYQGMRQHSAQNKEEAAARLRDSARLFATAHNWHQAARSWQLLAELELANSEDEQVWGEASLAARRSHDRGLIADITLRRYLKWAEVHAADEEPPKDAEDRMKGALEAARRADREDLASTALRYSLLLMPATADLSQRQRRVLEALATAHVGGQRAEMVLMLSLLSRLQAAAFQYQPAEKSLEYAIAFSEALGDADLEKVLRRELEALKEQ
jgi:hypothetical protein